jgi:hypothetical protein
MEATNTAEMSVNLYQTTVRNNQADSLLHCRSCENTVNSVNKPVDILETPRCRAYRRPFENCMLLCCPGRNHKILHGKAAFLLQSVNKNAAD